MVRALWNKRNSNYCEIDKNEKQVISRLKQFKSVRRSDMSQQHGNLRM